MSAAENTRPQPALHEHYSFLLPAARRLPRAEFVERTRDVVSGVALCLELIHSSNIARDVDADSDTPILNVYDTDRLARFAIASARLLEHAANVDIQSMNDRDANSEEAR